MAKRKFRTPRQKAKDYCRELRDDKDRDGKMLSPKGAAYRAGYVDGRGETLTSISYAQARKNGTLTQWREKQKPFREAERKRRAKHQEKKKLSAEWGTLYRDIRTSDMLRSARAGGRARSRALASGASASDAELRATRAEIADMRQQIREYERKRGSKKKQ